MIYDDDGDDDDYRYVSVLASHLIRVPDQLSMEQAACVPEVSVSSSYIMIIIMIIMITTIIIIMIILKVWLTAYQLLHFVGKIQPGDSVLVHAGGSGVSFSSSLL